MTPQGLPTLISFLFIFIKSKKSKHFFYYNNNKKGNNISTLQKYFKTIFSDTFPKDLYKISIKIVLEYFTIFIEY